MLVFLVIVILFVAWVFYENKAIQTTHYDVVGPSNLRIVQVSDFHNNWFGKDGSWLLKKVKLAKPDIIVISGDLIDAYHTKETVGLSLASNLLKIAPVYYSTGNHEARVVNVEAFLTKLREMGVVVLRNESIVVDQLYEIVGFDDPRFVSDDMSLASKAAILKTEFDELLVDTNRFRIVLSHSPELIDFYRPYDFKLLFSGHAHGGQWRVPLIGPIFAPEQGMFPKSTQGMHELDFGHLIVSRGLGNSSIRYRLWNRPELVIVDIHCS